MYEYITETPLPELKIFPNCKETWAFSKATFTHDTGAVQQGNCTCKAGWVKFISYFKSIEYN